jgi:hypothetical protein
MNRMTEKANNNPNHSCQIEFDFQNPSAIGFATFVTAY